MTSDEWLVKLATSLGVPPPDPAVMDVLLEVASVAAHASERPAAPISCWLIGVAGISPSDALALVRSLAVG